MQYVCCERFWKEGIEWIMWRRGEVIVLVCKCQFIPDRRHIMNDRINVTERVNLEQALAHTAAKMNPESSWFDTLANIGKAKKSALRAWAKVGDKLNTLQVTLDMSNPAKPKVKTAWSPGTRTLATEGPTYLTWDTGSHVELKGMHVLKANNDIWVGGYEWGKNTLVLVIYRRETGQ